MPSQNIHVIAEAFKNLEEVSDAFAVLQKQFRYMQEHIDVENIISKSLTAEVIKAGSITADEITVTELSALSANLGHIIAGLIESVQIFGSYIATRNGTYPRAEMSNTSDLFGLLTSVSNYIKIMAFDSFAGAPQLEFSNGSPRLLMYATPTFMNIQGGGDLSIVASGDMYINDWKKIVNSTTGQTLYDALLTGPI